MALSEQQKRMLVGGAIAFIMIFSVFGFVMNYAMTPAEDYEYGEYRFKSTKEGYTTLIADKEYTFFALPTDVDTVPITEPAGSLLIAKNYAITYDPDGIFAQAMAEAQFLMEQGLPGIKIIRALTDNNNTALPELNCANSTSAQPVIYFHEANETGIRSDGTCLIVDFIDQADLFRQEEFLRYKILEVIE